MLHRLVRESAIHLSDGGGESYWTGLYYYDKIA